MRRILLLVLALLIVPVAASAGGGGGFGSCGGFGEGPEVLLRDNCFEATAHFTDEGTVTVSNEGEMPHTYTAVDGSFDTGQLRTGQEAEVVAAPGVHRVYCTLHSTSDGEGMAGVLIVGSPELAAAGVTDGSGEGPVIAGLLAAGVAIAVLAGLGIRRRRSTTTS